MAQKRVSSIAAAQAAAATPTGGGPDLISKERQRLKNEAKTYLEGVSGQLQKEGLDVSWVALQGLPGEAIVRYAQNEGIDLIAIATHGHSGLGRIVFGSVADHVLQKSALPILLIKPQNIET